MKSLILKLVILFLVLYCQAYSKEVDFSANVDRNQITLEESVSLRFSLSAEQISGLFSPEFQAPDFDVVNEYSNTSFQSIYDNGQVQLRNTQQLIKVLKPRKTGELKISGIQLRIGNQVITSPAIQVRVVEDESVRTSQNIGRVTVQPGKSTGFFVRAEVDKSKIYKGEQVVVSYYLYARVKVFNLEARKYPTLNGFLREDLEMPILGAHLEDEPVILEGVSYRRALLVRYAAYPLQAGRLKIDPLAIRAGYYRNQGNQFEEGEDLFTGFFRQLTPLVGTSESEPVTLDVLPLPQEGKPDSFTGGVGDFNVTAAVDKYEVRANEAITLTVKVEGRGNVAGIGEPKGKWPDTVELYDSKGNAKTGKGGVGSKVFEFLLIPRAQGKLTLPALEFSFFDPTSGKYVTRTTEPFEINVLESAGGGFVAPKTILRQEPRGEESPGNLGELRGLKKAEETNSASSRRSDYSRLPIWLSLLGVLLMGGWVCFDFLHGYRKKLKSTLNKRKLSNSKNWDHLKEAARKAQKGAPWDEVIQNYEFLCGAIYDALDGVFVGLGSRSLSRFEVKQKLVDEQGIDISLWEKISSLLEFAETVRFATRAGAISEQEAREKLVHWVEEGKRLARALGER